MRYKKFYGSWTRPVAKRPLHSQCSCENKQRLEPCWTCDKMERTSQSKVTKLCLRLNYFQNCHLPSGNFYLHKAASNNTDRANIKRRIHYVSYIHNSVCINAWYQWRNFLEVDAMLNKLWFGISKSGYYFNCNDCINSDIETINLLFIFNVGFLQKHVEHFL